MDSDSPENDNMELQPRKTKTVQVTFKQKKKLLELITKNPALITGKTTLDFTYLDAQKLWHQVTRELNSIPGAKKTWKQWRKTWQDLRSKAKKQQKILNGAIPSNVIIFSPAEQEALGLKNVGTAPVASIAAYNQQNQQTTEFVPLETDSSEVNNFQVEIESSVSLSEPESPPEAKVFTRSYKIKNHESSRHSDKCTLNFDLLAAHGQRKLQLKEDFINYKKDYLRKKLKIIKEQTEALKAIAMELSEK